MIWSLRSHIPTVPPLIAGKKEPTTVSPKKPPAPLTPLSAFAERNKMHPDPEAAAHQGQRWLLLLGHWTNPSCGEMERGNIR